MDISFSVVTFNNEDCIENLILSILSRILDTGLTFRIYVIDNNSKDNTVDIVKNIKNSNIVIIHSKENIGFGAAHNLIVSEIESFLHIIVNPDIILYDDFFTDLKIYFEKNPKVGLVSPKVMNMEGTVQVLPKKNPRLIYLLSRRLNFRFLTKFKDEYEMKDKSSEEIFEIEFATGCFMAVRTTALKQVRGFDERYFMYCEDADLSRELSFNYKIVYNPRYTVYHNWHRGSSRNVKLFIIHLFSVIKYVWKWRKLKEVRKK